MEKDLLQEMERCIIDLDLSGKNILCAVSGGPDSMFLLYALKELAKKRDFCVYAVHINHQIRDEEAWRDQKFVENICSQWMIPCDVVVANIPGISKMERISLETAGRNIRRQACLSMAEKHHCDLIALGHHANDQAETVLMNLFRGSGSNGLIGMQEHCFPWWRPMLGFLRADIEQAVDQYQIPFVTDSTNQELHYTRNYFRTKISEIKQKQPQVVEHIVRTSTLIAEDESYLQNVAQKEAETVVCSDGIDSVALSQLDVSIAKRILQNYLKQHGLYQDISYQHIQMLLDGCKKGDNHSWSLPKEYIAVLEYDKLNIRLSEKIQKYDVSVPLDPVYDTITPWGRFHYLTQEEIDLQEYSATDILTISSVLLRGAIIRSRRAGDRIMLSGMQGRKKIQDYFVDKKIPKSAREGPLLVADTEDLNVLWIVGHVQDARCYQAQENKKPTYLAFSKKKHRYN